VRTSPRTIIGRDVVNGDSMKIVMQNGTYDVSNYSFGGYTSDVITLNKLPIAYVPGATCDKFVSFLREVADESDIPTIQEFMGYCLYGSCKFEKAMMLIGSGANGKGVLLYVIEHMLGEDNRETNSLQQIEDGQYAAASLFGKMLNVNNDLSRDALKRADTIKQLITGDGVKVRNIYERGFVLKNRAKFMFSTNNPPKFYDMTDGFMRRWIFLNFNHIFDATNGKCNPNLRQELTTQEELSGVFNWSIEGLQRLLANGRFSDNRSTEENRKYYTRISDPLAAFIEDCVVQDDDRSIPFETMHELYRAYCMEHKITTILTKRQLNQILPEQISGIYKMTMNILGKRMDSWGGITVEGYDRKKHEERIKKEQDQAAKIEAQNNTVGINTSEVIEEPMTKKPQRDFGEYPGM
jgi:putative DNA primase/helicase